MVADDDNDVMATPPDNVPVDEDVVDSASLENNNFFLLIPLFIVVIKRLDADDVEGRAVACDLSETPELTDDDLIRWLDEEDNLWFFPPKDEEVDDDVVLRRGRCPDAILLRILLGSS